MDQRTVQQFQFADPVQQQIPGIHILRQVRHTGDETASELPARRSGTQIHSNVIVPFLQTDLIQLIVGGNGESGIAVRFRSADLSAVQESGQPPVGTQSEIAFFLRFGNDLSADDPGIRNRRERTADIGKVERSAGRKFERDPAFRQVTGERKLPGILRRQSAIVKEYKCLCKFRF